jgi:DNA-binding MarR family transcriptional regulator
MERPSEHAVIYVVDALSKSDYEALAEFRHVLRRFLRFTEEGARESGLTPQQHQVLLAIKGRRGRSWANISELTEALQLRHHAVVGLVDRCAAGGLVRRESDPDDRRLVRVELTPRGEEVLARLSVRNLAELQTLRQALTVSLDGLPGPVDAADASSP